MSSPAPVYSPPPRPGAGSKRRKVSIEIYFVLYLSAIVLLLGTSNSSKHEDPDELIRTLRQSIVEFEVGVEKVAMVYTMIPASVGAVPASAQLRKDSVNVVKAWGSVSDVRFEIAAIRDTVSGEMLPVESATIQKAGDFAATVRWRPNGPLENRVYTITVAASAQAEVPADYPRESRARVEAALRSEGRVRDTVTFTVSVFAVTNPKMIHAVAEAQKNIPDTPSTPSILAGLPPLTLDPAAGAATFRAIPTADDISAVSGESWNTKIIITGADPTNGVETRIEPEGIDVLRRDRDGITVGGRTPMTNQVVRVTAIRSSDGETATTQFQVRAAALADPAINATMFVGETYRINFSSAGFAPERISVVVKDGSGARRSTPLVEFRPQREGQVIFERWVDGRLTGSYDAVVTALPKPGIIAMRAASNEHAIIETRSYGTYNGIENKVALRVLDGNVGDDPEEIDYDYDPKSKTHIQKWRLVRKSGTDPFGFTVWALDRRGSDFATQQRFVVPDQR